MVELGILADDEPVELLEGVLVVVSPQGPPHSSLAVVIRELLAGVYHDETHVQDHSPIDAGPDSLPEPDVAVIRGRPRDYLERHPRGCDVIVAVEVSVTSHAEDRAKAALYARAGIPVYWRVDVPGRRVEVHEDPTPDGVYRLVTTKLDRDRISPPGQDVSWRVAELLP